MQEWGRARSGGSLAFNCEMVRLIGWCLLSTIFLWAVHIVLHFSFYLTVLLSSKPQLERFRSENTAESQKESTRLAAQRESSSLASLYWLILSERST